MRNLILLWVVMIISTSALVSLKAQQRSAELSDIVDKLMRSVEEQMPGWTHDSVAPIEGSRDVVIERWILGEKAVSVTIIRHSSHEEAVKKIKEFAANMKANKNIPDAGEEQYTLGTHRSIIFRKHNFTVNINVKGTDLEDEKQLSKRIARLAADAL